MSVRRATVQLDQILPADAGAAAARLWIAAPRPPVDPAALDAGATEILERATWLCLWAQVGRGGSGSAARAGATIDDLTTWLCKRPILGAADPLGEHDLPEGSGDDVEILETVLLAASCRRLLVRSQPVTTRQAAALASISPSYIQAMVMRREGVTSHLETAGGKVRGKLMALTADSVIAMLAERGVQPWGRSKA